MKLPFYNQPFSSNSFLADGVGLVGVFTTIAINMFVRIRGFAKLP
jgi:hypothetical protein